MPNRILSSSLLSSESLTHLSGDEERLFNRLVLVADDWGRFEARSTVVRSACFPAHDGISVADIDQWIASLIEEDIIQTYSANGRLYGHFCNWWKYQRWRNNESKHPGPPDGDPRELPVALEEARAKALPSPKTALSEPDEPELAMVAASSGVVRQEAATSGSRARPPGSGSETGSETGSVAGDEAAAGAGARALTREGPGGGGGGPPEDSEFLNNLVTAYQDGFGGRIPKLIEGEMRALAKQFPDMPPEAGKEAVHEAIRHGAESPWPYVATVLHRVGTGEGVAGHSKNGHRRDPPAEKPAAEIQAEYERWQDGRRTAREMAAAREPP